LTRGAPAPAEACRSTPPADCSKGHPLGATGVSQIIELVRQLRGEAEGRQVEGAKTGLAVNFGGFGNNVVATILTTK